MEDLAGRSLSPVLEPLRPDETRAATTLLARSYATERLFAYVFARRKRAAIERALRTWFRVWTRAAVRLGSAQAARVEGRLAGVAIALPPGGVPLGVSRLRFNLSFVGAVLRMTLTSPRAYGLVTLEQRVDRLKPAGQHWHLVWVGVDPEFQRRGIGSALARDVVSTIDARRFPVWLLTYEPHARSLFESLGFAVEEEVRSFPDGPTGWMMRKSWEPHGATALVSG